MKKQVTPNFSFQVLAKDLKTHARLGIIRTPHGEIKTPAFSPVATAASVKALDPEDLKTAGSQVVLANTYHLSLRPGTEIISKFGGFAPFMGWDGPTITDSGGYQVSFLWQPKRKTDTDKDRDRDGIARVASVTDEGAVFVSHIDGSRQLLTPEKSMEIQHVLGADIIMAFDQPLGFVHSPKQKEEAFKRTLLWEEKSYVTWQRIQGENRDQYQALFGIIQGGTDPNLTRTSLSFLLKLNFPGLAIGGETIGIDPKITAQTLDTIIDLLPEDKPLHALGLGGGPKGILEAVGKGVDLFDNTSITRQARSGLLFIYPQDGGKSINRFRLDITRSLFKGDKKPISQICQCYTCLNFSRAYLHHLIISHELLGLRLASIHNVHFINSFMSDIRNVIKNNNFLLLKKEWI